MSQSSPAQVIAKTRAFARETLEQDSTGHDWWHVDRVTNLAKTIAAKEGADLFVVELGALLHDIADWKFHNGDTEIGPRITREWLAKQHVDEAVISEVEFIVRHISFKGGTNKTPMRSLEGKIVQDADRLDAIGAIGIARTFAFGGSKQRQMHNPEKSPQEYENFADFQKSIAESTTINHFYEKLLLLKDRMNTKTGREIAQNRHEYLENFLKEFYAEWDGER
jgi:uncharacterized protein